MVPILNKDYVRSVLKHTHLGSEEVASSAGPFPKVKLFQPSHYQEQEGRAGSQKQSRGKRKP